MSSDQLLFSALLTWPFLLQPLVDGTGKRTRDWDSVFAHPFFAKDKANSRPPKGSYLDGIAALTEARSRAGMWARPELLQWLFLTAQMVLNVLDENGQKRNSSDVLERKRTSLRNLIPMATGRSLLDDILVRQDILYSALCTNPVLQFYIPIDVRSYQPSETGNGAALGEEFLHPMLDDPMLLGPQAAGRVEGDGILDQLVQTQYDLQLALGGDADFDLGMVPIHLRGARGQQVDQRDRSPPLDLSRPLIQLFFLSLLPWIRLPY